MFVVTVTFQIKEGRMPDFLPLMIENAQLSKLREPECHHFDVCCDAARNSVFLYEIYASRAAFDAHLDAAHFKSFDAAVQDMVASKTIKLFDEVYT